HWRYWLWVLVIAKCLLPPVLTIPVALLPPEVEPVVDFLYTAPSNDIVPETYSGSSGTDYNAMIPEYIPPVSATPMEETEIYTPTFGEKYNRLTLKQKLAVVWVLGAFIYLVIAGVKAIRLSY
ncbi:MAG: hypothetical protein GY869_25930, partial [Planctomycetes bacterium]|nr:hypothetical protein [Planctomycetota bacterium]